MKCWSPSGGIRGNTLGHLIFIVQRLFRAVVTSDLSPPALPWADFSSADPVGGSHKTERPRNWEVIL